MWGEVLGCAWTSSVQEAGHFPRSILFSRQEGTRRGTSLWLGTVLQSSRTRLCVDDSRVKAAQNLAHLMSKGSAASFSVSGASTLEKNIVWELDFCYDCFQSGSVCCWKAVLLESSSDFQCVMTSRLKLIPYFTLFQRVTSPHLGNVKDLILFPQHFFLNLCSFSVSWAGFIIWKQSQMQKT